MTQEKCTVLSNKLIARDYYELIFSWNESFAPKPGQFLTIKPEGLPLLRRPFAFSGFNDGKAGIIYKTVGNATKEFSKLKEGDSIDVLGPLGESFTKPEDRRPILIAGGIGLGPMFFTANQYAKEGLKPLLIVGARDKGFIPELEMEDGVEVVICTDDGSMGFKGNVIEYLKSQGEELYTNSEILACGPHIMLKVSHEFAVSNNIPCQVSLEEMMACAVGACYGCVVETNTETKYKRVCKDGPVFDSREIIWT